MSLDIEAVRRHAYGVLLPVLPGLVLGVAETKFLRGGGRSLLLAESRPEYLARTMSGERQLGETPEAFRALAGAAAELAGGAVIIAVDQELGGIQRMHGLVTPLPTREAALSSATRQLVQLCSQLSDDLVKLGANLCLSPVLDVVRAPTPWLEGRNLGPDPAEVSRIGNAYINGLQRSGRVAATAKHFPGHRHLPEDPAMVETVLTTPRDELDDDIAVFRAAIETGVKAIMMGPTIASALDPKESASTSSTVMSFLRERLGFRGLIVTDGLDEPSIARGRVVADVAVMALTAGADLLLVPGGDSIEAIVDKIVAAVGAGVLPEKRLSEADGRVRALAEQLGAGERSGPVRADGGPVLQRPHGSRR